ncbi:hypothetical protein CRENBAI_001022 [Crenichthys baileyi]|uniref:Uncharacterized protein n=1 Tax=Crenichthys baileyi TaxID=28760 RepID=A0AAV9S941_9TELE
MAAGESSEVTEQHDRNLLDLNKQLPVLQQQHLPAWTRHPLDQTPVTHMERVQSMSTGQPCQVRVSEHLISYLGTLEPCVDMHRSVSYIAWSYWGQERSGGTEALQMFFISGPQGKSVTTTPGSFCSELGGSAVTLCHSLAT